MAGFDELAAQEAKGAPSDKIYNSFCLVAAFVAVGILLACGVVGIINRDIGLVVYKVLFFPIVIILLVSLYVGLFQLLRNTSLRATFAVIVDFCAFVALTIFIIMCYMYTGRVYIPFLY